jgi:molecular chaperone HscB
VNYYELLEMPLRLSLSEDELQNRFYEKSRQWHPDRFARKSASEQQQALDVSSNLNDAYRTLRDPIRRAEYVLKQEGFEIGEQGTKDVPPELLEEVFEFNMALEEADEDGLEEARVKFTSMLSNIDRELSGLFASYDANPNRETLAGIRAILNRRKYIQNLVRQATTGLATA